MPGYRLLTPLGRGGFGEVWKCEAPGGLLKAVKFIVADGEQFRQELAAFEQIKAIRHPFLLGLDRVELVLGELVMVMELADCQLHDRLLMCQAESRTGIPREELLGYLEEVAEALDMMGSRYGLQHLDVKPENLFLVAGHAKVGDYGLVRRARLRSRDDERHGFTPRYTPPEVLMGRVDTRSDQYSLALVYAELLTGAFPYSGRTGEALVNEHLNATPNLNPLSSADQPIVGRALSKQPADRFLSCTEFIRTLARAPQEPGGRPATLEYAPPPITPPPDTDKTLAQGVSNIFSRAAVGRPETVPEPSAPALAGPRSVESPIGKPINVRAAPARRQEPIPTDPFAGLEPVMPVSALLGTTPRGLYPPLLSSDEYVERVVLAAQADRAAARKEGVDGPRSTTFLCTLPAAMVPLKLTILAERWWFRVEKADAFRVVLWRESKKTRRMSRAEQRQLANQRHGLEVVIALSAPPFADVTLSGCIRGVPDDDFVKAAQEDLPEVLNQIQGALENLNERRNHPRLLADLPVRVYPLYPDGVVGTPLGGQCRDISLGGVRLQTTGSPHSERVYVEFHTVEAVSDLAVYLRVVRLSQDAQSVVMAGRFRTRGS